MSVSAGAVRDRATIIQRKTGRSELDLNPWPNRWLSLPVASMKPPSLDAAIRLHRRWLGKRAGLDSAACGTHSMRRTKAAQVYRKTANLRAVQLLLGHTKLESTVRYLGIEVDDALSISEQIDL